MDIRRVVLIRPFRDGRVWGRVPGSPYTLMRLASLVPDEIPVEIWDENVAPPDYTTLGPHDLVGISSMTLTIERAEEIARVARRQGATVVVGGVHATLSPEHVASFADVVVVGEGYNTWPQIIRDVANDTLQPMYVDEEWKNPRRPGTHLPARPRHGPGEQTVLDPLLRDHSRVPTQLLLLHGHSRLRPRHAAASCRPGGG
ncbi:MAG: cobalamin-dependent protein [Ardenticatenia bacterium]|nr:cobalamin-dependent protein [Ardenticatenia bacterium]